MTEFGKQVTYQPAFGNLRSANKNAVLSQEGLDTERLMCNLLQESAE